MGILKVTITTKLDCQKRKNTYYINNPVHQNYGHIKALSEVLGINTDKFISIVCISSQAKVRVNSKL